jgi:hypothetical protein
MTSQMTTKSVDAALSEVARWGMLRVSFDVVKATALDVWYGSEVRDLTKLRGPYQKDVLFLVERLVYYNVVPQPRKKALLEEVRRAGGRFQDLENQQLEDRFNDFLPDLQPMQTRHFDGLAAMAA